MTDGQFTANTRERQQINNTAIFYNLLRYNTISTDIITQFMMMIYSTVQYGTVQIQIQTVRTVCTDTDEIQYHHDDI